MHLAYFKVSSVSFLKQLHVQSERKGAQETSAVSRVKLYQLSLLPVCVTSWAILWRMMILLYKDSTWICRTSDGVNCYKGIKSNHVFQIRQFCSFTHLNLLGDCKSHCLLCKSYLSSFIKTISQHLTWGRDTPKNVQLGGFINWETMRVMFEFP